MQHSTRLSALAASMGLFLLVVSGPAMAQDEAADDTEFALSRAGDAKNGKRVFGRCRACHGLKTSRSKAGPSLRNIFGRPAGTEPDYAGYSKALRESGILWNERTLDQWLSSPVDFLPGNKMNMAPIRSARERMDLIAYLRQATE
jgi:cytochrome c